MRSLSRVVRVAGLIPVVWLFHDGRPILGLVVLSAGIVLSLVALR